MQQVYIDSVWLCCLEECRDTLFDELEAEDSKRLMSLPPSNAFEEMIRWTQEGKLWTFPIDNEQGTEAASVCCCVNDGMLLVLRNLPPQVHMSERWVLGCIFVVMLPHVKSCHVVSDGVQLNMVIFYSSLAKAEGILILMFSLRIHLQAELQLSTISVYDRSLFLPHLSLQPPVRWASVPCYTC